VAIHHNRSVVFPPTRAPLPSAVCVSGFRKRRAKRAPRAV